MSGPGSATAFTTSSQLFTLTRSNSAKYRRVSLLHQPGASSEGCHASGTEGLPLIAECMATTVPRTLTLRRWF
ncbi:hypothetical protein OHA63_21110 [Streptomyces anulatus]|nr:hypothetical protein [Streptomyces anulatus]